jgi:hypothetical protein
VFSEFNEDEEDFLYKQLYSFVEKQGVSLASALCRNFYRDLHVVSGPSATDEQLVRTIERCLENDMIEEIDLIVHMHGQESGGMCFANRVENGGTVSGTVPAEDVADDIRQLAGQDRLRMYYTTACYGAVHAEAMIDAGFSCSAGAVGVNTNAHFEYPRFLNLWRTLRPFEVSVRRAFNTSASRLSDEAARRLNPDRFQNVDSRKRIFGDGTVTIRTDAL